MLGLERAIRLFPIRTGVLSPDWLVVDGRADTIGAAGVQGAGYVFLFPFYLSAFPSLWLPRLCHISIYGWAPPDMYDQHSMGKWVWNERMSWLD